MKAFSALQEQRNSTYGQLAQQVGLLPIKITPFYQKKIDAELAALGHEGGPLHQLVYPSAARLELQTGHEVADWVDDRANMPLGQGAGIIHKYPDRILFTPTSHCAAHCLYCFRQDVLAQEKEESVSGVDAKLDSLVRYIATMPLVREVILSGGDPLMLATPALENILQRLDAMAQVETIRIHTRVPIFAPQILKDHKIALLAKYKVRFVIHAVHPYEICDEVSGLLHTLHAAGVRLYNQFPLLRGTNDHPAVLGALLEKLDALHVQTISIFVPEPIYHSASTRIGYDRMLDIISVVRAQNPPWLASFRFCLDTPLGKVLPENLIGHENDHLIFAREGKAIRYPDFPAALDVAGDVGVMLWKKERSDAIKEG